MANINFDFKTGQVAAARVKMHSLLTWLLELFEKRRALVQPT